MAHIRKSILTKGLESDPNKNIFGFSKEDSEDALARKVLVAYLKLNVPKEEFDKDVSNYMLNLNLASGSRQDQQNKKLASQVIRNIAGDWPKLVELSKEHYWIKAPRILYMLSKLVPDSEPVIEDLANIMLQIKPNLEGVRKVGTEGSDIYRTAGERRDEVETELFRRLGVIMDAEQLDPDSTSRYLNNLLQLLKFDEILQRNRKLNTIQETQRKHAEEGVTNYESQLNKLKLAKLEQEKVKQEIKEEDPLIEKADVAEEAVQIITEPEILPESNIDMSNQDSVANQLSSSKADSAVNTGYLEPTAPPGGYGGSAGPNYERSQQTYTGPGSLAWTGYSYEYGSNRPYSWGSNISSQQQSQYSGAGESNGFYNANLGSIGAATADTAIKDSDTAATNNALNNQLLKAILDKMYKVPERTLFPEDQYRYIVQQRADEYNLALTAQMDRDRENRKKQQIQNRLVLEKQFDMKYNTPLAPDYTPSDATLKYLGIK